MLAQVGRVQSLLAFERQANGVWVRLRSHTRIPESPRISPAMPHTPVRATPLSRATPPTPLYQVRMAKTVERFRGKGLATYLLRKMVQGLPNPNSNPRSP